MTLRHGTQFFDIMKRRRMSFGAYPPAGARLVSNSRRPFKRRSRAYLRSEAYDPVRLANVEQKVFDIAPVVQNVSTTLGANLLCAPVPGTDFNNRVGRKITIKSVFIRGFINLEASATPITGILSEAQYCRIMLVWDSQPNGATFAAADLLANSTTAYSQLNINNRERFRVLKEKNIVFDPIVYNTTATQSLAAWNRTLQNIKIYKKLKLPMVFNAGTAGTIADVNTGALFLVTIGTVASGADTDSNLYFTTRVRYTDA